MQRDSDSEGMVLLGFEGYGVVSDCVGRLGFGGYGVGLDCARRLGFRGYGVNSDCVGGLGFECGHSRYCKQVSQSQVSRSLVEKNFLVWRSHGYGSPSWVW